MLKYAASLQTDFNNSRNSMKNLKLSIPITFGIFWAATTVEFSVFVNNSWIQFAPFVFGMSSIDNLIDVFLTLRVKINYPFQN